MGNLKAIVRGSSGYVASNLIPCLQAKAIMSGRFRPSYLMVLRVYVQLKISC